ncbi:MAG TPA: glycosyltransferase [Actinomycetota bacterium]|nr:glycosyltransferase [Actinomycetota bacterium]
MKVSVIATVLDADGDVGGFLASIAAQRHAPDEIVIVDGGSTDGTLERLRAADGVTVLEAPGAGIARGRNLAIAHATHDVIAVADADCAYGPGWLEALLRPIDDGADVAMGVTDPVVDGFFTACVASLNLPLDPADVDEATFAPSARSVAFRRDALESVGGYPEWLPIGEDMWVDLRWRERGMDMRLAPEAVARWRPRATLAATWTQYARYARGDARAGMHPERHALRFGVYGALVAALASRRAWPKVLAAAGAVAYTREPVRRSWARLDRPGDRALATVVVPLLLGWTDAAKMAGYATGLLDRGRDPGR